MFSRYTTFVLKQPTIQRRFLLVFGVIGSFAIYYAILSFRLDLAGILFVSVLLHEVGHALIAQHYGAKTRIIFIPILGAAMVRSKEPPMNERQDFVTSFAGPFVNLALMGLGLALMMSDSGHMIGGQLVLLNAGILAVNLLPLPNTDGSKMIRLVVQRAQKIQPALIVYGFASYFVVLMFTAYEAYLIVDILLTTFYLISLLMLSVEKPDIQPDYCGSMQRSNLRALAHIQGACFAIGYIGLNMIDPLKYL